MQSLATVCCLSSNEQSCRGTNRNWYKSNRCQSVTQDRIYQNYQSALLTPWFSHHSTESVTNKFLQSVGFVTTTGCGSALIKIKLNVHYVHSVGGFFQCQRKHCLFVFEEIQHLLPRNENRIFLNYMKKEIINQMASLLMLT